MFNLKKRKKYVNKIFKLIILHFHQIFIIKYRLIMKLDKNNKINFLIKKKLLKIKKVNYLFYNNSM